MSFDINTLITNLSLGEGVEKQASEVEVPATPSVADELKSTLMTKSAAVKAQEASDLGAELARRLMEKSASTAQTPTEVILGDNMSALAASVEAALTKQADEVQAQPQINTETNAALAAEQTQVDNTAEQSGGTVEAQLQESIKKGLTTPSATATSEDQVDRVEDNMQKAAAVSELVNQGHSFYDAAELVAMADSELQKEAAFAELTAEGYSYDDATALIKLASEEEFTEELSKEAALSEFMAEGYAFDTAVEMIKEAEASYDKTPGYGNVVGMHARSIGRSMVEGVGGAIAGGVVGGVLGGARGSQALSGLGAMVGGVHGSLRSNKNYLNEVHNKAQEKKASFESLLAEGHSFDDAVEIIKEAGVARIGSNLPSVIKKGLSTKAKVAIGAGVAAAAGGAATVASKNDDMDKKASFESLLSEGYSFDEAVNMIKEAGAAKKIASKLPQVIKKGLSGKAKAAIVAGAAVGTGAVAAKKKMTKEAAFSELLSEGYTFDQALATVQA